MSSTCNSLWNLKSIPEGTVHPKVLLEENFELSRT